MPLLENFYGVGWLVLTQLIQIGVLYPSTTLMFCITEEN